MYIKSFGQDVPPLKMAAMGIGQMAIIGLMAYVGYRLMFSPAKKKKRSYRRRIRPAIRPLP